MAEGFHSQTAIKMDEEIKTAVKEIVNSKIQGITETISKFDAKLDSKFSALLEAIRSLTRGVQKETVLNESLLEEKSAIGDQNPQSHSIASDGAVAENDSSRDCLNLTCESVLAGCLSHTHQVREAENSEVATIQMVKPKVAFTDGCSSDVRLSDVVLGEHVAFKKIQSEVPYKPFQPNFLSPLLPSIEVLTADDNQVWKTEFIVLRSSDSFCTQAVRQNAYEVLSLFLPPAKPPDAYDVGFRWKISGYIHGIHLRLVLVAMREHQLFAKMSKCAFAVTRVDHLGHYISTEGVFTDSARLRVVEREHVPPNLKQPPDEFVNMVTFSYLHNSVQYVVCGGAWLFRTQHGIVFPSLKWNLTILRNCPEIYAMELDVSVGLWCLETPPWPPDATQKFITAGWIWFDEHQWHHSTFDIEYAVMFSCFYIKFRDNSCLSSEMHCITTWRTSRVLTWYYGHPLGVWCSEEPPWPPDEFIFGARVAGGDVVRVWKWIAQKTHCIVRHFKHSHLSNGAMLLPDFLLDVAFLYCTYGILQMEPKTEMRRFVKAGLVEVVDSISYACYHEEFDAEIITTLLWDCLAHTKLTNTWNQLEKNIYSYDAPRQCHSTSYTKSYMWSYDSYQQDIYISLTTKWTAIENALNQRKLVPEEIMFALLARRLEEGYCRGEFGFILDSIPRNRTHAEMLDHVADIDLVLNFKCFENNFVQQHIGGVPYSSRGCTVSTIWTQEEATRTSTHGTIARSFTHLLKKGADTDKKHWCILILFFSMPTLRSRFFERGRFDTGLELHPRARHVTGTNRLEVTRTEG